MYESYLSNPNVIAFLDVLAYCEGARYNTVYGGGTFVGLQHPQRRVTAGRYTSDAAGRYQFLYSTWRGLGLPDFSPANQDLGAVMLIAEKGALNDIANGDLQTTVAKVRGVWPSLPGGSQQTRNWSEITNYFQNDLVAQGAAPAWQPPVISPPSSVDTYYPSDGGFDPYADINFAPGLQTSGIGIGAVAAVAAVLVFFLWWSGD